MDDPEVLMAIVAEEDGTIGLAIFDDDLSDAEVIGMLEMVKQRVLAGIQPDEDDSGPPRFTVVLN